MNKIKQSYKHAQNKKIVRDFLLQKFEFENVVGLAGPDINDYLQYLQNKGAVNFEIYENNSKTVLKQLMKINIKTNISLICGDILKANPNKLKSLYDLDFCASVRYLTEHISKFKDNFIMTFSTRPGVQFTINTFFNARKETIIKKIEINNPIQHTLYITNKSKYIFIKYFDSSSMCCFAKI